MLEVRNLKKIYKMKKGVSVNALNNISIKFPEKGLVFLLGKSGSGKSTLLNLLGGLDKYDSGEIIIKGVSSKDFKQSHFDSYRNTYVGFIFQEYNVLEEFSVGANIALALELQNKKATDQQINKILEEVDLTGFGNRKPNELSGGQKQRVAIARALVKNPQIIMADEPTGALDSNTGKQVLDTLKKLSKDKLIIVVSHDREFAETYGDRIIELADGKVISDVEKNSDNIIDNKYSSEYSESLKFDDDSIIINKGYHLTEEDRILINNYLDNLNKDIKVKVGNTDTKKFTETDESKIKYEDKSFKLIKSKLPLKNAFKIGTSSLKHKKIRLAITILLSFVAFTLFALADTFGNYNHIKTCTKSILDTKVQYATVQKSIKHGSGLGTYWSQWDNYLSKDDIKKINKDTGLTFTGVVGNDETYSLENIDQSVKLSENDEGTNYATYMSGFTSFTKKQIEKMGYKVLAGEIPTGNNNDIAISEYVFETFKKAGYVPSGKGEKVEIKSYNDLIGKSIALGNNQYKIVGIFNTNVDIKRYEAVAEDQSKKTSAEKLVTFALTNELDNIQQYSLSTVAIVGKEKMNQLIANKGNFIKLNEAYIYLNNDNAEINGDKMASLKDINMKDIHWIGAKKEKLADNEVIVDIINIDFFNKGKSEKETIKYLKNNTFTINYGDDKTSKEENKIKVVGYVDSSKNENYNGVYVVPQNIYNFNSKWKKAQGEYSFAITGMPKTSGDIEKLVRYCYTEQDGMKYQMQNSVTYELDSVNEVLKVLSKAFLYVGIGFAIFAMIMLANFIATSISYKKQEIGILRAIGARSHDVFRIFFAESFVIAMINFVLACVTTGILTMIINNALRIEVGILISILSFGIRQVALLLLISVGIAFLASFVPVYKIASKRPIDAIRNK
ncbi:MAG: ABC transporter ATP-binding protein/permease [Eubacterium sp.]|nr:ABC transporter ATP-binding protein/permease [Eubacterium sp.]